MAILGPEENITIEDARIAFRNLSGRVEAFNPDGKREFAIMLTPELAQMMIDKGWNVKFLKPGPDDGDDVPRQAFIKVGVNYRVKPPRVILLTSRNRTPLTEELVGTVDFADIISVDVTLRPYDWETAVGSGRKAYLQTMYVKIHEDPLDIKYAEYGEDEE
jgi:hypothetical protein